MKGLMCTTLSDTVWNPNPDRNLNPDFNQNPIWANSQILILIQL